MTIRPEQGDRIYRFCGLRAVPGLNQIPRKGQPMNTYELSSLERGWLAEARANLSYQATNAEEHREWRERALPRLRALFGVTPELAEPPEIILGEASDVEGIQVRYFQHRAYDGEMRDHILLQPEDPQGVVIALNDATQLEVIAGLDHPELAQKPDRGLGLPLAGAGLAVIVTELRGYGRTGHPKKWGYPGIYVTSVAYTALGKDPLAQVYAKDNLQTVAAAKHLFPGLKVGFVGISKAGDNTAKTAALSEDVDLAYVASGCTDERFAGYTTEPHLYPPGLSNCFWRPDYLCFIAPRPLRLSYGLQENFAYRREAEEKAAFRYALRAYENAGASGRISQLTHPEGHVFIIEDIVSFFATEIRRLNGEGRP